MTSYTCQFHRDVPAVYEKSTPKGVIHVCEDCADRPLDPWPYEDQYIDARDLDTLPPQDPMIEGVLVRHGYHLLTGRDGTLKTFTALDWACCLATGKTWQGHAIGPSDPAYGAGDDHRVLFVAGEGAHGLRARQRAWEQAWRLEVPYGRLVIRKSAVNLYRADDRLAELLTRIELGDFTLVVVDTLRRASGGADGNGSDMGVVVDNLERIKRATWYGSVLVVAHTDKSDNDTRGFSGIEDDADVVWHAKRDDNGDLTLKNTKMKDGPDGATIRLRPRIVTLDGLTDWLDQPVTSLVLEAANDGIDTVVHNTDSDERVMAAMRTVFSLTGATANELIEVTGMAKSTFYEARARLLSTGQLVRTGAGSRQRLELPSPDVSGGSDMGADLHLSGESGGVRNGSGPVQSGPAPLKGPDTGQAPRQTYSDDDLFADFQPGVA